jgi:hypothetical protein
MSPNKLVISLEGNDQLKEYLTKKSPGDVCEFEVKASMDEMTPEQAVFSVKEVEAYTETEAPTEMDEDDGESPEVPAATEKGPEAVMIAFGKKK